MKQFPLKCGTCLKKCVENNGFSSAMKKLHLLFYIFSIYPLLGQEYNKYELASPDPKMNIGLGIGLDYGGLGGRITFLPVKKIGVFGAVGYAVVDFGYNVGASVRITPDNKICPTVSFMYGYNGVINVKNAAKFDKIYYGTSLAGGCEFHFRGKPNFLNVELVVPFRSSNFHDDWDKLKQMSNIKIESAPLPVAISVGYHFAFK